MDSDAHSFPIAFSCDGFDFSEWRRSAVKAQMLFEKFIFQTFLFSEE